MYIFVSQTAEGECEVRLVEEDGEETRVLTESQVHQTVQDIHTRATRLSP